MDDDITTKRRAWRKVSSGRHVKANDRGRPSLSSAARSPTTWVEIPARPSTVSRRSTPPTAATPSSAPGSPGRERPSRLARRAAAGEEKKACLRCGAAQ